MAYVDDLFTMGPKDEVDRVLEAISGAFATKITGVLSHGRSVDFLGRKIYRSNDGIDLLPTTGYIDGMAETMLELAGDPEKAAAMGKAGRKSILELCDPGQRKAALQSLIASAS